MAYFSSSRTLRVEQHLLLASEGRNEFYKKESDLRVYRHSILGSRKIKWELNSLPVPRGVENVIGIPCGGNASFVQRDAASLMKFCLAMIYMNLLKLLDCDVTPV